MKNFVEVNKSLAELLGLGHMVDKLYRLTIEATPTDYPKVTIEFRVCEPIALAPVTVDGVERDRRQYELRFVR